MQRYRLLREAALMVAAAQDRAAPPALHHAPLVSALRAAGAARLSERTLAADHVFVEARPELSRILLSWLRELEERP